MMISKGNWCVRVCMARKRYKTLPRDYPINNVHLMVYICMTILCGIPRHILVPIIVR